jgi:hypothetical protein
VRVYQFRHIRAGKGEDIAPAAARACRSSCCGIETAVRGGGSRPRPVLLASDTRVRAAIV